MKLLLAILFSCTLLARAEDPAPAFEAAAKDLKFLAAGDLLFGRLPQRVTPEIDQEAHNNILTQLFARNDTTDQLLPLLKHNDPKVRSLAVAALLNRNDARVLPEIAKLADDDAPTLPHPALVAMIPGQIDMVTPLEPQKVRDFPRVILRIYMEQVGYYDYQKFVEYWAKRKDRASCAGWLAVEAQRVANQDDRKQVLHTKVSKLADNDRPWSILFLGTLDHPLFPQENLLAAAKSLGPDALVATLAGHCPSDDPDLHEDAPGITNPAIARIRAYILHHATPLLRESDADAILKLGKSADVPSPWYAIAAAQLARARARKIIEDAFTHFPREGYNDAWARADLAIASWQIEGLDAAPRLVEWFYSETLKNEGVPHSRSKFLEALDPKQSQSRQLIAMIISDQRFARLDWSSLKSLSRLVNAFSGREIITATEMQNLQHPYGEQHVVQNPDQAMKTFPAQTQALNDTLADWRKRIAQSVPGWTKDR